VNIYIVDENKDGEEKTLADLRETYLISLYNTMSGMRIQELLQKGTPPFVMGSTRRSGFVRGYDAYSVGVTANPNEEGKALEAIMIETERIKRFGFVESELQRAKTNFLTNLESQFKQKDKIRNDSYCREYSGNYTSAEPIPGIDFEFNFAKQVIPTITVDEISVLAKKWIKDSNRTIVITGPTEGVTHLSEDEAKSIIASVETMEIEPYVDAASDASLISQELTGSKVVTTKQLPQFDGVEWTLGNNVKVVYRHADYEKDKVSLLAYSLGGTSLWENESIPSADMAGTFINSYGVGEFDAITLQKMLTGKKVSLSPTLGSLTEGFNGSSTPKDFETMMQLVYLYFEHPRFDTEAHNALMSRYIAYVANMEKDPQKIMRDSLAFIRANYNPRVRTLNTQFLNEVNIETIEKIYKDRIQDAGDFTFVIV
jgi:zinc protease